MSGSGNGRRRHAVETVDITEICRSGSVDFPALCSVTPRIEKAKSVSVVGPSGSGKSTLLNLIGMLSLLLTTIAGLYSAWRAASFDPIVVLRKERSKKSVFLISRR